MNKIILAISLLALTVLAACAPTQTAPQTTTCPNGEEVPQGEDCPVEEPEAEETIQAPPEEPETQDISDAAFNRDVIAEMWGSDEQPTPPVGASLSDIQARALQQTIDGYSYTYELSSSESGFVKPKYNLARIHLREGETAIRNVRIDNQRDYDTYINGTAYCIECREQPTPTTAEMPDVPQPLEILLNLENVNDVRGAQSIDGRQTLRLSATIDGEEAQVFIDRYSGLPVEVRQGELTHSFTGLSLQVRDESFEAPY